MPYKYFLLGRVTPIRVGFNKTGLEISAEIPDESSAGFKYDNQYLLTLKNTDEDVRELDENEFTQQALAYRNRKKGPGNTGQSGNPGDVNARFESLSTDDWNRIKKDGLEAEDSRDARLGEMIREGEKKKIPSSSFDPK